MKLMHRKFVYIISFSGLLLSFFIVTFPFGLLKEALLIPLAEVVKQPITIDKMAVGIPPRLSFTGITLAQSGQNQDLKLHKIQVGLKLTRLLLGKLHVWVRVYYHEQSRRTGQGVLLIETQLALVDMAAGAAIPTLIKLQAERFPLTDVLRYSMQSYIQSPAANLLVTPLLSQLSFKGFLQSDIELGLTSAQLASLEGSVDLQLQEFKFASTDPNLVIPEQSFAVAQLKARLKDGMATIAPGSAFQAADMGLGLAGTLQFKDPLPRSTAALTMDLSMAGAVLEQLGVVVQMALLRQQEPWNGQATMKLQGALLAPQISMVQPVATTAPAEEGPMTDAEPVDLESTAVPAAQP